MSEKQKLREIFLQTELLKKRKVQKYLIDIGLTPGQGQARILQYLDRGTPVNQRELAEACMLDVTTMSRAVNRLEKLGLLKRERDPDCRRSYRISLTQEGKEKTEEIRYGFRQLEEYMCEGMSGEEISVLIQGIMKVRDNLNKEQPTLSLFQNQNNNNA